MAQEDGVRRGRHGTPLLAYNAVQGAVERLTRKRWRSVMSPNDLQDLGSAVMEKYFTHFGRDELPAGPDGGPNVPVGWLMTTIEYAGIDFLRRRQVRPPEDFANQGDPDVQERIQHAVNKGNAGLGTLVGGRVDLYRALADLAIGSPADFDLIRWRLIDDKTFPEVAVLAGKSEAATKQAFRRAINRLRTLLEEPRPVSGARAVARRIAHRG